MLLIATSFVLSLCQRFLVIHLICRFKQSYFFSRLPNGGLFHFRLTGINYYVLC
nr:MAG TPA: hypothetical protein [Caudoviricetes sp.]